jgi:hypothetical protein
MTEEDASFLGDKQWLSLPAGSATSPFMSRPLAIHHEAINCLARIPRLLQQTKLATCNKGFSAPTSVLHLAMSLRTDLLRWYDKFTMECVGGEPVFHVALSELSGSSNALVYIFRDVASASVLSAYNAALIKVNKSIETLSGQARYTAENLKLAGDLQMSVEFCWQAGYCGAEIMIHTLPVALSVLPQTHHAFIQHWILRFSTSVQESRLKPAVFPERWQAV